MSGDDLIGWESDWRIRVVPGAGKTHVIVKGQVYMSWEPWDEGTRRLAIVQIYENGLGTQEQLAEAFGLHVNTVQKYICSFTAEGSSGLLSRRRGPRSGWKLSARVRGKILAVSMIEGVEGVKAIQRRLREQWHEDVSLPSIRQVLEENGLHVERGLCVQSDRGPSRGHSSKARCQ